MRTLHPNPKAIDLPEFTHDRKAIVYPVRENGSDTLWLKPLDSTRGRQITNVSIDTIKRSQFSPPGKNLGVLCEHNESDVVL